MTPDPAALMSLLLADPRLPVGGHVWSGQLEPALRDGLAPEDVPAYCRARLATVVRVEAATAAVARHVVVSGGDLGPTYAHWAARTPGRALRDSAAEQGRGLLRLGRRLWLSEADVAGLEALPVPARPLVLGVVAARTGMTALDLGRVVAYDDTQTVLGAALKLTPQDPVRTAGWLWELTPAIEEVAVEAAAVHDPADIPSPGAPQIEAWAQAHAHTTRRLFRA